MREDGASSVVLQLESRAWEVHLLFNAFFPQTLVQKLSILGLSSSYRCEEEDLSPDLLLQV